MHYDVTRIPLVKTILLNRWPQFVLTLLALGGFLLAMISGFIGTPVGSRNFSIIFVWIAWWALLMLIAVPLFGRSWCSICPIPLPGEWMQRGALLKPGRGEGLGLGWRWPNKLRNIWIQNGAFALIALFSIVVLTRPQVTAIVLSAFLFISVGASVVFERRAFCRYLCPLGGFIGLYSQLAPIEVRVKETSVCATHKEKTCYTGNDEGYGCPWQVFPPGQIKNTNCGICLECLRTCPHENIAINIRPFGADLNQARSRKLDEAYKAFIMLGSALIYSLVLLGPWGQLKMTAYSIGSLSWVVYVVAFLFFILVALPGLFWLCVKFGSWLARSPVKSKQAFITFAYALAPLGLAAWVAFSLSFVLVNLSYIWVVLSDPFGWGWNLFGTAKILWTPYIPQIVPLLQIGVLLGGLIWAAFTTRKLSDEKLSGRSSLLQAMPIIAFCLGMTIAFFGVLVA
jgi:hypothetical protein